MHDKIPIRARAVIAFLMMGVLLALAGCMNRGPKGDDAQVLKRRALTQYVANTNAIHEATQKAYKAEATANARNMFEQGIERIKLKTDADGKVPAADTVTFIETLKRDHDQYLLEADQRMEEIRVTIAEADKDIYTALKLDDLVDKYAKAGVDAAFVQSAVDSILEIAKSATKQPKVPK